MIFVSKGRFVKAVAVSFLMIAAVIPSAFGKVVLGVYGGGTLSSPAQVTSHPDYQTDETWAAGSHLGYFIEFYNQKGHWGVRLEVLKWKDKETYGIWHDPFIPTIYSESKTSSYFGATFEYSFIGKATQRLIPFVGLGIMIHPYLFAAPDFPPDTDVKADLGLKFKLAEFVDFRAQFFYALGNKLLAGSLGIDLSL